MYLFGYFPEILNPVKRKVRWSLTKFLHGHSWPPSALQVWSDPLARQARQAGAMSKMGEILPFGHASPSLGSSARFS